MGVALQELLLLMRIVAWKLPHLVTTICNQLMKMIFILQTQRVNIKAGYRRKMKHSLNPSRSSVNLNRANRNLSGIDFNLSRPALDKKQDSLTNKKDCRTPAWVALLCNLFLSMRYNKCVAVSLFVHKRRSPAQNLCIPTNAQGT